MTLRTTALLAFCLVLSVASCSRPTDDPSVDTSDQMVDPIDGDLIPGSPALSPSEALASFVLEDGFEIDLVAAEPDVVAPVAMTFDGDGAMWIVEMRAYMEDIEGSTEDKPVGTIRVLRDLDGDNHYETATTFVDGLVLPRAVAIANGGILVAEPPNLWFYENDDYTAGKRTLVDSTYAVGGNPEHQPNGLVRAIDNWIYSAKADVRYRFRDGIWEKEKTEFRGQWGLAQDDFGRLFYNHNSATLLGDNLTPGMMSYNPNHKPIGKSYGPPKASNKLFPIRMNPGVNRAYLEATLDDDGKLSNVTSACGPTIYRGDNFPGSHYGNAFVMEPAGNLVKRVILRDSAGVVSGTFPYEGKEFLASTDERFRPVSGYTGPDGSLYIVDMYRGVIQHKTYLTEYLQRQIEARGLAQPLDRGRIYRVRSSKRELASQSNLIHASTIELVRALQHPNGWWRDTAQQLLVERGDFTAGKALRELSLDAADPVAQVHALWTLEGLQMLVIEDLERAARRSRSPKVLSHILRLAKGFAYSGDADRALHLVRSVVGGNREIDLNRILSLQSFHPSNHDGVLETLSELSHSYADDPDFVDAVLGGLQGAEVPFMDLLNDIGTASNSELYLALEESRFAEQVGPTLAALSVDTEHTELMQRGRVVYERECALCHGAGGDGITSTAPTLLRSSWVLQDPRTPIRIILDGLSGPLLVNGSPVVTASDVMPGFRNLTAMTDDDIAALVSFIRNGWSNRSGVVTPALVASVRDEPTPPGTYTAERLLMMQEPGFEPLFVGQDLESFETLGGAARFVFNDGILTGTTAADSPNTFLATTRHYTDFILEFEVKVDSLINSGVQIRSNSRRDYQNGRVHGYQVEIDPSARAWSAGIYDEGRRGWLFDLRGNRAAREAFRQNDWNHYRVEVNGEHIRTWINGVLAADLIDDMTDSGFIAFQVHSVGEAHLVGRDIQWRNVRIKE